LEVHLLQNVMRDLADTTGRTDAIVWATLHATLIARSLSRIFGRASNIAEHCYFMKQGVIIKHKKTIMPDRRDEEHQGNPEKR
jgi:phosphate uptake regulator